MNYRISVVGSGYVGLSLAILLSQENKLTVLDIDLEKIKKINSRISPISDAEIDDYFLTKRLNLYATSCPKEAHENADFIIIAIPTDYNPETNNFDTKLVDEVVKKALALNKKALIIIKSTLPIGYTEHLQKIFSTNRIIFSPEFLREGKALHDNLYPSRIVVGGVSKKALIFSDLLKNAALKKNIKVFNVNSKEAEAIKLFSNTYLAMRVSFFNELDTFAAVNNLDTKKIINGVCADSRIKNTYNNPSFGYGGYCLPKDSKQLLANYENIPQSLIKAIVESNTKRKKFIANEIINMKPATIGIYLLTMKKNSDNIRSSAILDIIKILSKSQLNIIIFEPLIDSQFFDKFQIYSNLEKFKNDSDIIVTNRKNKELLDVEYKCFSRDIFNID
ncbi:nucleotide sugar dehydrogenase [Gammaproteobacteria bacterium]|nr:nucleotide sugar dehydrogenase [Gammaproteobacteria bacterium]